LMLGRGPCPVRPEHVLQAAASRMAAALKRSRVNKAEEKMEMKGEACAQEPDRAPAAESSTPLRSPIDTCHACL